MYTTGGGGGKHNTAPKTGDGRPTHPNPTGSGNSASVILLTSNPSTVHLTSRGRWGKGGVFFSDVQREKQIQRGKLATAQTASFAFRVNAVMQGGGRRGGGGGGGLRHFIHIFSSSECSFASAKVNSHASSVLLWQKLAFRIPAYSPGIAEPLGCLPGCLG